MTPKGGCDCGAKVQKSSKIATSSCNFMSKKLKKSLEAAVRVQPLDVNMFTDGIDGYAT